MNFFAKTLIALSLLCTSFNHLRAQNHQSDLLSIKGTVLKDLQNGILGASVSLINTQKNSFVNTVTDSLGKFKFTDLKEGTYTLKITHINLKEFSTTIQLHSDTILQEIYLTEEKNQLLEDVIVIATQEDIQQRADRIIINVESSPVMSGSSVFEILRKSPGIAIGALGDISMKGKKGIMVMINDKPIRLSGSELIEYLQGISAINISKVELITSPPSKYEASGASGIINIILKRNTKTGWNGNVSLNNGFGRYLKSNNGTNINYNKEHLSITGNYSYARRGDFVLMDIHRVFSDSTKEKGYFSQDYDQKNNYSTHSSRMSIDYQISKKLNMGTEFGGNFSTVNRRTNSTSLNNQTTQDAFNTTLNRRNNYGLHLNAIFKLDTLGSYVNADADYSRFILDDIQTYDIQYSSNTSNSNLLLNNNGEGRLKIRSVGLNYMGSFKNQLKIECGLKFVSVNSNTQTDFFNISTGTSIYDNELSGHFLYHEKISAAFFSIHKKYEKLEFDGGCRYENTRIDANEIKQMNSSKLNYSQLFPSANLTYKIQKEHALKVSFNRRIQRPGYGQINPFFYFLDLNTRFSGNPELKPSTNFSSEFSYTFKDKYSFSAGYFIAKDAIIDIQVQDTKQQDILIQQPVNIDNYKVYSLNAYVPIEIMTRFKSSNSFGLYLSNYSGKYGVEYIENSKPYLTINSTNTFQINNWTLQLSGFYEGQQFYGNSKTEPITIVSLGIQKKILNKKGTLSINLNDPFKGNKINSSVSNNRYLNKLLWRRDSRTLIFGLSWKFGSKQNILERKKSSADEEKKRAS